MPSRSRSFAATSQVAARNIPWTEPKPFLLSSGVFIGYQLNTGKPVYFNPQRLVAEGIVASGNVGVTAGKRMGKDTLCKCLATSLGGMQAGFENGEHIRSRSWAFCNKLEAGHGEWQPIAHFHGCDSLVLMREKRFNLLEVLPGMTDVDQARLLVLVLQQMRRQSLTSLQALGVQVATFFLRQTGRRFDLQTLELLLGSLTKEQVKQYLHHGLADAEARFDVYRMGTEEAAAHFMLALDAEPHLVADDVIFRDFQKATAEIAADLNTLRTAATYGGMWDGTDSLFEAMSQRFVHWDMNGLPEEAKAIFTIVLKFIQGLMGRENGGIPAIMPHYVFNDEQGSEITNLSYALVRTEDNRKARARPTIEFDLFQNITDPLGIGEADSQLRHLGQVMFKGTDLWIIGRQSSDDATLDVITRAGATDAEAWTTTLLDRGEWGVLARGYPMEFFQHEVLDCQWPLIDTTSAARRSASRQSVADTEEFQQRLRALSS